MSDMCPVCQRKTFIIFYGFWTLMNGYDFV